MTQPIDDPELPFAYFNEVGIISQLSNSLLAATLPDGLHPSHFSIVNHLVRMGDGKTPIRIADAMQVTKNTMTHSLRVLEDRGLIRTEPNPDDARGKLVWLTDKGRTFRADAITRVVARFEKLLTPDILAAMQRGHDDLKRVRRHLDENRP